MDWVQALRSFVHTVQAGSLSCAGRLLGCSAASISRHIDALETQLGTPLLKRSSRRLALTDAGELYLPEVEAILRHLLEANRSIGELQSTPQGMLKVHARMLFGQTVVCPAPAELSQGTS